MSIPSAAPKRRRKRGVILTQSGLERFQVAKSSAEYADNQGQRYTLETLSERTEVGIDTLTKVLGCEMRVDKQTLKCCFQAFGLTIGPADYYKPDSALPAALQIAPAIAEFVPLPPGGQLPLESPLYIQRHKAEADSYAALDQPGALIRIKGARQSGKTSLMARLAQRALARGYQPVLIRFQLADKSVLQNLDQLLQWFCASVGRELGLAPQLDTYWDSLFGSKVSCKIYFEQYLLAASQRPVVLILDDVDRLFRHLDVADEFFGLLRTWYEDGKTTAIWKQLRMVIAQSSEVYIPLNINKSPFNVGLAIPLEPFSPEDVRQLAKTYGLDWSLLAATDLCHLIAGQPYLSHLAIDRIWRAETTLHNLLCDPLGGHIFLPYLQQQLRQVQQQPQLTEAITHLIANHDLAPASLSAVYQLQNMGVVVLTGDGPKLACNLFRRYFSKNLSSHTDEPPAFVGVEQRQVERYGRVSDRDIVRVS